MSAAPDSSCWTLLAVAKLWLCSVVTPNTTSSTTPMPTSRARSSAPPRANFGLRASVVTRAAPLSWPVAARITESSSASARENSAVIRPSRMTRIRSAMPSTSGSSEEIISTARPSATSPSRMRCTSALVPTSMPRVGSSIISSEGPRASHLPSTTFCWFPPDSVETAFHSRPNFSWSRSAQVGGEVPLAGAADEAEPAQPAERGQRDVPVDAEVHDQALLPSVLGHQGDSRRHRGKRRPVRQHLAVHLHHARGPPVDAEDGPGHLAAPRADQPGQRDDLAAADREGDVVQHALTAEVLDLQHDLAGRRGRLGEQHVEVAADHRPDDLVDGEILDGGRPDEAAVPHDRDALADGEDFLEPVRDEQHRRALSAQRPDDLEEPLDLDRGQRRGRLVHHEDVRIGRQCLSDLDDLLVGDGQAARLAAAGRAPRPAG